MAYTCTVQEKRTFPVSIGSHIFYVEQYQLTGIRKFAEQTTTAGMSVFTNQAIRSRVLHMEGRFLRTDPPAELLLALETALQEQTSFTAVLDVSTVPVSNSGGWALGDSCLPAGLLGESAGSGGGKDRIIAYLGQWLL